jgi:hypothetical protein
MRLLGPGVTPYTMGMEHTFPSETVHVNEAEPDAGGFSRLSLRDEARGVSVAWFLITKALRELTGCPNAIHPSDWQ